MEGRAGGVSRGGKGEAGGTVRCRLPGLSGAVNPLPSLLPPSLPFLLPFLPHPSRSRKVVMGSSPASARRYESSSSPARSTDASSGTPFLSVALRCVRVAKLGGRERRAAELSSRCAGWGVARLKPPRAGKQARRGAVGGADARSRRGVDQCAPEAGVIVDAIKAPLPRVDLDPRAGVVTAAHSSNRARGVKGGGREEGGGA